MNKKNITIIILTCLAIIALAALFASAHPDGLEWVAEKLGFAEAAGQNMFTTPFADYAIRGIRSPFLSSFLSGVIGVSVILGIAGSVWKLLRGHTTKSS